VRITDIALSTPVVGARPAATRRSGAEAPGAVVSRAARDGVEHPDEVAASALARAAGLAHAGKVVAASNEHAAASVKGDLLDLTRVP
jgi:hypothetical protein